MSNGHLVIERPDEPPVERPIEFVSALHIHGYASVTSPCVAALLAQGAPVVWRGVNGYPIGYSQPLNLAGLAVRQAQFAAKNNSAGLEIACALAAGKIVNMRGVLRRRLTAENQKALQPLQHYARKARTARSVEALLGVEGAATAHYFSQWRQLLTSRAPEFEFEGRSRRPPRDAVNALLSYAYAVLAGECVCAAAACGFDPRLGYLHQPRPGRPALALDLMEPFRPVIADAAVLAALNRGQFREDDFAEEQDGLRMSEEARRALLGVLENRLAEAVTFPGRSQATYRQAISFQAQAIAVTLLEGKALTVLERP